LDLAFTTLNLPSVIARAHADNASSIRVMQKLGLRFERTLDLFGTPSVLYRIRSHERARG
jgi:RimJ/RimL family protein N-acetyltransferase